MAVQGVYYARPFDREKVELGLQREASAQQIREAADDYERKAIRCRRLARSIDFDTATGEGRR